jgi:hypothetical protein|eukprot:COSAG06_NODE_352_length_16924_cov_168.566615_8_plen_70_part_00
MMIPPFGAAHPYNPPKMAGPRTETIYTTPDSQMVITQQKRFCHHHAERPDCCLERAVVNRFEHAERWQR